MRRHQPALTALAGFGRFGEAGLWILGALDAEPLGLIGLFDMVTAIHGPVGPGTLLGALVRLEQHHLVIRVFESDASMYRLTSHTKDMAR